MTFNLQSIIIYIAYKLVLNNGNQPRNKLQFKHHPLLHPILGHLLHPIHNLRQHICLHFHQAKMQTQNNQYS